MARIRKPFQGIWNIIRFNRHFYLLSFVMMSIIFLLNNYLSETFRNYINIMCFLMVAATVISLAVSFYIYDLSGLYKLNWLNGFLTGDNNKIVIINAGFDETSILLKDKFQNSELIVFDFYDPSKHTEVSIKRARKAYPPFPYTKQINTSNIPLKDNYADKIFVTLSAHEIRAEVERNIFFRQLKRILNDKGKIIVTEHLRDIPNFLAYNIGVFHFITKSSWCRTFKTAELKVYKEIKITPFITTFILEKYGTPS